MLKKARSIWILSFICLIVSGRLCLAEAESEFRDTPYFTWMPNYKIDDTFEQEFADYNFYNDGIITILPWL